MLRYISENLINIWVNKPDMNMSSLLSAFSQYSNILHTVSPSLSYYKSATLRWGTEGFSLWGVLLFNSELLHSNQCIHSQHANVIKHWKWSVQTQYNALLCMYVWKKEEKEQNTCETYIKQKGWASFSGLKHSSGY